MISPKQKTFQVETEDGVIELVQWVWSPMKAFSNLPKIGKTFAVPVSMLYGAMGEDTDPSEAISQALFMLFDQMEEQDIWKLFVMITDGVKYQNRDINLDVDLGTDLNAVLTVVAEALMNNYGSLYTGKGLGSLFQRVVPMVQLAETK